MSTHKRSIPAEEALKRLKEGNRRFVESDSYDGDIRISRRSYTTENGQHPFAAVLTCADSRVIPEVIFSTGIGDLFVVRCAGNVVDDSTLGSMEYAVDHLGVNLVLVMGHTHCGAVIEAIKGHYDRHSLEIINDVRAGIGFETDPYEATKLNVLNSMMLIADDMMDDSATIVGAVYDTQSGRVEFLL